MSYVICITIISTSTLMVLLSAFFIVRKPSPPTTCVSTFQEIAKLLAPPDSSTEDLLRARSISNTRLLKAFNINNTFVSPLLTIHTKFRYEAAALLRKAPIEGAKFNGAVTDAVDLFVPQQVSERIDFGVFIQSVTFVTMATALLDVELELFDPVKVAITTRNINEIWRLSKTSAPPNNLEQELAECLRILFPNFEGNPLDFILPIYETTWRVVATVIAKTCNQPHYRETFKAFLEKPTRFAVESNGTASVQDAVDEALRLFPPVKRISRATVVRFPFSLLPGRYATKAADVEALHRSSIWGPNPEDFDPLRHTPTRRTKEQKEALIPFGYGPLKCIAFSWAPRAVGLIAAAVLVREDLQIIEDGCASIGGREGWAGWSVECTSAQG